MEEHNTHQQALSIVEKFTFGLLLLVVFLAPLFFVPNSFASVQFATSLLFAFGALVSVFAFIVATLKKGSIELPQSKLFFFGSVLAVPVVYTLSSLSHGISRMSFLGYTFDISTVGFILLSFAFLFLVSVIFRTKERIFYSYITVVTSLLLVTLFWSSE